MSSKSTGPGTGPRRVVVPFDSVKCLRVDIDVMSGGTGPVSKQRFGHCFLVVSHKHMGRRLWWRTRSVQVSGFSGRVGAGSPMSHRVCGGLVTVTVFRDFPSDTPFLLFEREGIPWAE